MALGSTALTGDGRSLVKPTRPYHGRLTRAYRKPMMKIHPLITKTEELAELCERLAQGPIRRVDTEFMRENTFWPLLCLVQIGNEEEAAAIDPLATGIDLTPMLDLLLQQRGRAQGLPRRRAGRRDHLQPHRAHAAPDLRHPDRDDGGRASPSRSAIRTWSKAGWACRSTRARALPTGARRPLTERQIEYAIGDVTHLAKIFPKPAQEADRRPGAAHGSTTRWKSSPIRRTTRNDLGTAWHRITAPSRKPERARPPEGARRLARTRSAGTRTSRAAGSCATRRSPISPAIRPRPRPIWPRFAGSRRAGGTTISAAG